MFSRIHNKNENNNRSEISDNYPVLKGSFWSDPLLNCPSQALASILSFFASTTSSCFILCLRSCIRYHFLHLFMCDHLFDISCLLDSVSHVSSCIVHPSRHSAALYSSLFISSFSHLPAPHRIRWETRWGMPPVDHPWLLAGPVMIILCISERLYFILALHFLLTHISHELQLMM